MTREERQILQLLENEGCSALFDYSRDCVKTETGRTVAGYLSVVFDFGRTGVG